MRTPPSWSEGAGSGEEEKRGTIRRGSHREDRVGRLGGVARPCWKGDFGEEGRERGHRGARGVVRAEAAPQVEPNREGTEAELAGSVAAKAGRFGADTKPGRSTEQTAVLESPGASGKEPKGTPSEGVAVDTDSVAAAGTDSEGAAAAAGTGWKEVAGPEAGRGAARAVGTGRGDWDTALGWARQVGGRAGTAVAKPGVGPKARGGTPSEKRGASESTEETEGKEEPLEAVGTGNPQEEATTRDLRLKTAVADWAA